jgi:nicotinate-nucleotide adenylyltransferase
MIIVYGGTFNPPTVAHRKIAEVVVKGFNPNKFILLPVGDRYTWKDQFVPFEHRFNMLKLLFSEDIFEVSDLENIDEYKGTYQSLKTIKDTYKSNVYFLLGADNLDYLDQWINYEKLVSEFRFIVLSRSNLDVHAIVNEKFPNYQSHFQLINIDLNISASDFRENPDNHEFIPNVVYSYLKKHQLYGVK